MTLTEIVIVVLLFEYCLVNYLVPEPIEDEIIHVIQANHYWAGDFSFWDHRITTPPGLYLASLILKPLTFFGIGPSVKLLRTVSLLFSFAILLVEPILGPIILLMPIVNPYVTLYYTDVPSLFMVLLADKAVASDRYYLGAFIDLLSLFFRQTNIVWASWHFYQISQRINSSDGFQVHTMYGPFIAYATVAALFCGFVAWNKGIVLGERSSHKPGIYRTHLSACTIFIAVLFLPNLSIKLPSITILTIALAVDFYDQWKGFPAHPYHLDPTSRHITSAIVKRLHANKRLTMLLAPIASLSKIAIIQAIQANGNNPDYDAIAFMICTMAATTPSSLMEPRYFIMPAALFAKLTNWDADKISIFVLYYLMADAVLLEQLVSPWRGRKSIIW